MNNLATSVGTLSARTRAVRWALCGCFLALAAPAVIAQTGAAPYPLPPAANKNSPRLNDGIFFWDEAVFPGEYRKEADGSFRLVDLVFISGKVVWVPVASVGPVPGADIDAYQRAAVAAVKPTPVPVGPRLPAHSWASLQDLIPGGLVRAASVADRRRPKTKGRSVMLTLSANSMRSFQAFEAMQQQVGAWAASQKDPAVRKAAEAFSRTPFKESFATAVATLLRGAFARVTFADDLTRSSSPRFDYALVLDLDFTHDIGTFLSTIDQLQKSGKLPALGRSPTGSEIAGPVSGDISWVLLDRALDVVAARFEAREQVPSINAMNAADAFATLTTLVETNFLMPAKPTADGLYFLARQMRSDWGWLPTSSPIAVAQAKQAATPAAAPALKPAALPPGQLGTEPPLLPGEVYVKTSTGCGAVFQMSDIVPPQTLNEVNTHYRRGTWTGGCVDGLLMGIGKLTQPGQDDAGFQGEEYAFGRSMGKWTHLLDGAGEQLHQNYRIGGQFISYPHVLLTGGYKPEWEPLGMGLQSVEGAWVHPERNLCSLDLTADKKGKYTSKLFPGCSWDDSFEVFGVTVTQKLGTAGVTTWCPNPRTTIGCEGVWQNAAAPIVAGLRAFASAAEQKIAERKRVYANMTAPWLAAVQAQKDAAAQKAATAKAIADREFAGKLTAAGAGELFAIADGLAVAGNTAESRQALRALVARFPEHPLATLAAKQMAAFAR